MALESIYTYTMKENNTYSENHSDFKLPDSCRISPFVVPDNFFTDQQEAIQRQVKITKYFNQEFISHQTVPEGYFDQMESSIFAKIAESNLKDQVNLDGFTAPVEYFDALEDTILSNVLVEQLKDASDESSFAIPTGYFDSLQEKIEEKIFESTLKEEVSTDGFGIPEHYFESLNEQILSTVALEKSQNQDADEAFSVPSGYFESLTQKIIQSVKEEETTPEPTKVISMPSRSWTSYASAAAVALVVGVGSYFAIQKDDAQVVNTAQQFASTPAPVDLVEVSDQELVSYLAQELDSDELIQLASLVKEKSDQPVQLLDKQIDDKDIEEYLNYML